MQRCMVHRGEREQPSETQQCIELHFSRANSHMYRWSMLVELKRVYAGTTNRLRRQLGLYRAVVLGGYRITYLPELQRTRSLDALHEDAGRLLASANAQPDHANTGGYMVAAVYALNRAQPSRATSIHIFCGCKLTFKG